MPRAWRADVDFAPPGGESLRRHHLVPTASAIDLARLVAAEQGLSLDWLQNEGSFAPEFHVAHNRINFERLAPGVIITSPEPCRVFALKLQLSWDEPQAVDRDEILFLVEKLELDTPAALEEIYRRYFPDGFLLPRAAELQGELFPAVTGPVWDSS